MRFVDVLVVFVNRNDVDVYDVLFVISDAGSVVSCTIS